MNKLSSTLRRIYPFIKLRWLILKTTLEFCLLKHTKGKPHGLDSELIISLTSYQKRFTTLHLTLKRLLMQKIQADKVILWVSPEDFTVLPKAVTDLTQYGLTIKTTPDIRSYTKIIPTLRAFPEAAIITFDDDQYYPRKTTQALIDAAKHHPKAVIANRTHQVTFDEAGQMKPYLEWNWSSHDPKQPEHNFLTGVGSVFYPPHCFHSDVLNEHLFLQLAPHADDVWLYWMVRLNHTEIFNSGFQLEEITWPSSQASALWYSNLSSGPSAVNNDSQIQNMLNYYGPLPKN